MFTESPSAKLDIAREIAARFPNQHPENFLVWANAALVAGEVDEAKKAIEAGLSVFPANRYPYGERRMTRERHQDWIDQARTILAVRDPQGSLLPWLCLRLVKSSPQQRYESSEACATTEQRSTCTSSTELRYRTSVDIT